MAVRSTAPPSPARGRPKTGPPNGFGTGQETGITINVQSGAEVTATAGAGIAFASGTVNNSGTIQGAGTGGTAISAVDATVNNFSGSAITGDQFGIRATTAIVNNAGLTEATAAASAGTDVIAVFADDKATVNNTGLIRANGANAGRNGNTAAIVAGQDAQVINSGRIEAIKGDGIFVNDGTATVDNSGAIQAGHFGIRGRNVNLGNAGRIEATDDAITTFFTATVSNLRSGVIRANGENGVAIRGTTVNVTGNAGTIEATGTGGRAIVARDTANVTNTRTGTVSGNIGIQAFGEGGVGSIITNSGAIIGTGGTAIKLSDQADTLTLLSGSRFVGVVDMGSGNDTVNVNVIAPTTRVSSLTSVALPTFVHFNGPTNITFSSSGFVGPVATAGTQIATLETTALAQSDRTLMDFTGGVSSLVQGRLNGVSANGAMMAMNYAPENSKAGPFTKAPAWTSPAPITVWANSFGGQRIQDATAETLRATSTAWGGAIGIDRRVQPNWLVGTFIGGGAGALSVDLGSQKVDTDYVFGGGYSRFEWASQFFDFTLQGGSAANKSDRLVLNNLAPERATASYNGWFISPEVAYGFRHDLGNGYLLTPTARLRYVAGQFDGYSETGSAQGLSVGSRSLEDFEERGELDLSRVTSFGGEHTLKTNFHGGVIALQRAGDANINAVLIGQNLAFATPGKGSTVLGRRRRLRLSPQGQYRRVRRGRGHRDDRPEPDHHRQRRRPRRLLSPDSILRHCEER